MKPPEIRILGPQDWARDGLLSGPGAAAARVLHRAFHERHLPLTPRLAVALARLQASARPDADPDWGRSFRLCREALHARGFGGTSYWRASLAVFPLVVAEPVLRRAAGAVGSCDLHGAARLEGQGPGQASAGAADSRIEAEVARLLSTPEAMGRAFWITAGLRLHAEAEALHQARLTARHEPGLPLIRLDVPVARLLFEVEPAIGESATRRALPKRELHPSARRRQGIRPKEGGVTGIRPSRMLEDLPDVLISELMLPARLVANKFLNEGMLVRHRPPSRQPRRDFLMLTLSDRRNRSDGGALAMAAWADAAIRLQILLAQAGRPDSDLLHLDIGATGLRTAALSADDPGKLQHLDPMMLDGIARTSRLHDTGLLPGFVVLPAPELSGPELRSDLLEGLGDLARFAFRAPPRRSADPPRGRNAGKGKSGAAARGPVNPAEYERCLVLLLLPENGPEARAITADFSAARAVAQARLRRLGAGSIAFAAMMMPDTPTSAAHASVACDFASLHDRPLTVAPDLPGPEALADWLGQLSAWMIELAREVIGA